MKHSLRTPILRSMSIFCTSYSLMACLFISVFLFRLYSLFFLSFARDEIFPSRLSPLCHATLAGGQLLLCIFVWRHPSTGLVHRVKQCLHQLPDRKRYDFDIFLTIQYLITIFLTILLASLGPNLVEFSSVSLRILFL